MTVVLSDEDATLARGVVEGVLIDTYDRAMFRRLSALIDALGGVDDWEGGDDEEEKP